MEELIESYEQHRKRKEQLEEELREAKHDLNEVEQKLWDTMEASGIDNYSYKGRRYYQASREYFSPSVENDELIEALKQHGYDTLIKEAVPRNTLSATLREIREENDGILPEWLEGIVKSYVKENIHRRTE